MALVFNGSANTIGGLAQGGLPDDSVDLADLSATGTASSSTYLRGDNSWAAAGVTGITSAMTSGTGLQILSNGGLSFGGTTTAPNDYIDTVGIWGSNQTVGGQDIRPGTLVVSNDGDCCILVNVVGVNTNLMRFRKDGSTKGSISTDGSNVAFNTSSDYRLKENQVLISDGITRLKTLKPYRFNWKDNPSKTVDGFFAHEVTAVPEAINGEKDGTDMQGLDYSKLVPLLTAALQEAVTEIETLKTKVAALEAG